MGLDVGAIGSSSLVSFNSGWTFAIWLFVFIFIKSFSIELRLPGGRFSILPPSAILVRWLAVIMKGRILLLLLFWVTTDVVLADTFGYADSLRLKVESKNFIVIHFHNWTNSTRDARYRMISTDQNPFTATNNYAYIECIDKRTGKTIFKKPSSALTKIVISKDEKYILGISKIMLWNPYQLIIYSTTGELIKKRHIGSEEAKLTKLQLEKFKSKFPSQYLFLNTNGRIYHDSDFYFVDFVSMSMPTKLGKAWDYLYRFSSSNHLSDNFSESVTNWVFWFYEANPSISFNYSSTRLMSVGFLDPKQKRISIRLEE